MKLQQLRNIPPPLDLKKLTKDDYELLWISDYYDAPISGMLRTSKLLYWFEMTQENDRVIKGEWFRRYAVVELSNEQLEKEKEVHKDFQKYVGTHWDCVQLDDVPKFIEGNAQLFYDKHLEYCKTRQFENNEVTAWFDM